MANTNAKTPRFCRNVNEPMILFMKHLVVNQTSEVTVAMQEISFSKNDLKTVTSL